MATRRTDPLDNMHRLTRRDRQLLAWLHDHEVLTTAQIATALFTSRRQAQKRLRQLRGIDAVQRVSFARNPGEHGGLRYTLGPLGIALHPMGAGRRGHLARARRAEIAQRPDIDHLLGVNGFFTDLAGHARRHPAARLGRWWSESHTAAVYTLAGIHPDGHGVWHRDDRQVGFFLEHDRGSEDQGRLLAKLPAYQRLAIAGPRYPILFHFPNHGRETNFHTLLDQVTPHLTIATAVHRHDPAAPIWWLHGYQGPRLRLPLHELPSDHGPEEGPNNPHRYTDTL